MALKEKFILIVYYALAYWLPGPPFPGARVGHAIRRGLAQRIFLSMGKNVTIGTRVKFESGKEITIGSDSNIGRGSWVASDTKFGDNVMTGPEIVVLSYNHEAEISDIPFNKQGYTARSPVTIGNNVWIGTRAIILPGVNVGDNSVVGAGAVVVRDVPCNSLAVGNPAKIIAR